MKISHDVLIEKFFQCWPKLRNTVLAVPSLAYRRWNQIRKPLKKPVERQKHIPTMKMTVSSFLYIADWSSSFANSTASATYKS
jgi:hypothetical protein